MAVRCTMARAFLALEKSFGNTCHEWFLNMIGNVFACGNGK
jgi:hypothetical protein